MQEVLTAIQKIKRSKNRPLIIAISGFGGAGKSTLAEGLQRQLTGSRIVAIDSFSTHQWRRNADWDNFDRKRFAKEVLQPARANHFPLTYVHEPWPGNPAEIKVVPRTDYLIVEGCSIFHPDLFAYYEYTIWVECSLAEAMRRGMWRDRYVNKNEQDDNWQNIWMPNDKDFYEKYHPDAAANVRFDTTLNSK